MLISFFLSTHRPQQFSALLDNLERTADDKHCFELVVKIDDDDTVMQKRLEEEKARRPFSIKTLVSPRGKGYADLWKAYNELWPLGSKEAYYVSILNDKVRFATQGWDTIIKKYTGFFSDHIFRLRTSRFRLRNYFDVWECWYAPDNFPFYSRRWIEIQGDWNACHVSDAFQQCVAFYLMRGNYPDAMQINRDIPVWGIEFEPQESGDTLSAKALRKRNIFADKAWYAIMGVAMQTELLRRARLLQGHIWFAEEGLPAPTVKDDKAHKLLEFQSGDEHMPRIVYSYRCNEWSIRWKWLMEYFRRKRFHYLPGLQRINNLSHYLGEPEEKYPERIYHNTR